MKTHQTNIKFMKTNLYMISLLLGSLVLYSCQEKEVIPVADFDYTFADPTLAAYLSAYPTHVSLKINNKSTLGQSYLWDFGNGSTSTEAEPSFLYLQSGEYTITLRVTSASGEQKLLTKQIKIVDRVLKQVIVQSLEWNAIGELSDWPSNKSANAQIEVGQRMGNDSPVLISELLYQSTVLEKVSSVTTPLMLPVSGKHIITPADLSNLVINLHGMDETGRYLSYSSGASGIGISAYIDKNTQSWIIRSGSGGTAIQLECSFE
jgi:PKD repeat protein